MNIFISISEGHIVRNLFENGLLDRLISKNISAITVFTPAHSILQFTERWGQNGNIFFKKLLPYTPSRKQKIFSIIRRKALKYRQRWLATLILSWERNVSTSQNIYYFKLMKDSNAVLLCTHIHSPIETPILNAARKLGIPSLGLLNSWDNVYKGINSHPDHCAVWNDINKKELIDFEGYSPKVIHPIGAPAFDPYFDESLILSREMLCEQLNLDVARPILLYATIGEFVPFFEETFLLQCLVDISLEFEQEQRPQIICRLHPWSNKNNFEQFNGVTDLVFSEYLNYVPTLGWTPKIDEVYLAASILKHVDVCITPGSTMAIETAIFDTPTIVAVFNDYQPEIWEDYYSRFCLSKHFARLIHQNLIPIARSRETLKNWIHDFLKDPTIFCDERTTVCNDYIQFLDGKSTDRLIELIHNMVE